MKKSPKPIKPEDRKKKDNIYWREAKPISSSDRKKTANIYW